MITTVADSTNVSKLERQVQRLGTRIEGEEIAHSWPAPAGSVLVTFSLHVLGRNVSS